MGATKKQRDEQKLRIKDYILDNRAKVLQALNAPEPGRGLHPLQVELCKDLTDRKIFVNSCHNDQMYRALCAVWMDM